MVSAQVRLALQAMRYYRLWIYASNLVLMAGVVIFASVAAVLLSDPRRQLLPPAAVAAHQPSVVYAYAALFLQGAVLPVVGCLGALRLSEKLLNSYWILLLVLLAGDIIVGLVWVFRFQKLVAGLVPDLKNRLSLDYGNDADFDAAWDLLQRSARCCGVESPADFNNSHWLANLADRPAWQPAGLSTNRVQVSSTPHGRPSLRPSLIRDQRVSRLPLPDSCCKSASFSSEQLRKNGHFMTMASEVPPGRKEVYGTGKHRQQLRDYNERYHERMMREQLHLQQQQQQQQHLAGNLSLNHRSVTAVPPQGSVRIQRRATSTTTTTAAPTIAMSPSAGHKKDVQHRQQPHRHRPAMPAEEKETDQGDDDDDDDESDAEGQEVECGGVWPSVGDVSDVHESGCGEYVASWLHMTGDTLFVLGYCVLAFIKLCFLAILRYELREMVAKIKILQSEQALMSSSTAAGVAAGAGPANNMPFTHCEMSGIRAVMARGAGGNPIPPALVATEVATDLHDNFNTPTAAGQASRESTHLPNGEVPSGGGGGTTTTTTSTTGLCALRIPRPRRQSSFSSGEYHLINPFVQQPQQLQQQGEEEEEGDNETDNDLFSPPDTPIHHSQQQQQQQQQHRTAHQLPQNNDNGADSDSGSHCALLPSSCNSTGPPQRRLIHKEWDPSDQTTTVQQPPSCTTSNWVQPLQQQQHENGWPGRPNGNNNEYHELREIKQTQI